MGTTPLNRLNSFVVLGVAYLVVFMESYFTFVRNWTGAQIDLLPVLMVYCGLSTGLVTLTLVVVLGGLWFDTLSANPFGVSVLPLFLAGIAIYRARELVLREQPYARLVLGIGACAVVPLCTVILLWGIGYDPLVGWPSLWHWMIMSFGGGLLTPICFWFFETLNSAFAYSRPAEPVFRADREIKRGRA